MLARDTGHPWREVDYSALRRAIWIDEHKRRAVWDLERRLWRSLYQRFFPESDV